MQVKVKFYGSLRKLTRAKEINVEVPEGSSVMELITHLSDIYGEEFEREVIDKGKIKRLVRIALNEEDIEDLSEKLEEGDEVSFTSR
ncbi:molybdopterin synthase sulfur carrier subunit [Thermococci archaeon]|nr:MAG: molybdopterin synthase sulfur carrier subunit [Thermococci archaeon]